jgi:hypothetical protein
MCAEGIVELRGRAGVPRRGDSIMIIVTPESDEGILTAES